MLVDGHPALSCKRKPEQIGGHEVTTLEGIPERTRKLPEGFICATQDQDIHQISNLQPGNADLVTLHIYSPPLLVMG